MSNTPSLLPEIRFMFRLDCTMAGPGRPGRIHKGDRDQFITRPARPVGDAIRARAAAAGMSYSDYIAAALAEHEGLSQYAPKPSPASAQGELQITEGGVRLQRTA